MTENQDMVMPVQPLGNYGGGYGGGFGYGGDWWLILILLFAFGGGWGGGFGGGFGGYGNMMLGYDFPWLLQGQNAILNGVNANTNAGFDHAATQTAISGLQNSVTAGFGDVALSIAGVNQNICQTGNGIVQAVNGGFANAETAANARQMANMQQAFNSQTAITNGMNSLASGLQNCCCENRANIADLKYTVATENCADRQTSTQNTQAILTALNAGVQSIKDQLCTDKIESKNDTIAQLRSELLYARGQASQDVQTAAIQAGQRGLANEVEQYVAPRPIPAYVVQNPSCCNQNYYGCSCGM